MTLLDLLKKSRDLRYRAASSGGIEAEAVELLAEFELELEGRLSALITPNPRDDAAIRIGRVGAILAEFETGCSCDGSLEGRGKPETCPECVRGMANAIRSTLLRDGVADERCARLRKALRRTPCQCQWQYPDGSVGLEPPVHIKAILVHRCVRCEVDFELRRSAALEAAEAES